MPKNVTERDLQERVKAQLEVLLGVRSELEGIKKAAKKLGAPCLAEHLRRDRARLSWERPDGCTVACDIAGCLEATLSEDFSAQMFDTLHEAATITRATLREQARNRAKAEAKKRAA